jgi:hypothetical protein
LEVLASSNPPVNFAEYPQGECEFSERLKERVTGNVKIRNLTESAEEKFLYLKKEIENGRLKDLESKSGNEISFWCRNHNF